MKTNIISKNTNKLPTTPFFVYVHFFIHVDISFIKCSNITRLVKWIGTCFRWQKMSLVSFFKLLVKMRVC